MKKNLKNQIALIVAVLLVCLYGIFGIPSGLGGSELLQSVGKRIHLGLDLQGGAHLILQVQVQDAVNDDTNNTVQDIEQAMRKANLTFSQVMKPDPKRPQVIRISGTSPAQSDSVSTLLNGTRYTNEYDVVQDNNTTWTLTMKPVYERDLDARTVQQAISTITDRVNALGVTEPQIAPYGLGANQILVELPGVSDMNQVKNMIKSTARLEIHAVVGGPFPNEQAALSSVGGALPPDEEILPSEGELAGSGGELCVIVGCLHGFSFLVWSTACLSAAGFHECFRGEFPVVAEAELPAQPDTGHEDYRGNTDQEFGVTAHTDPHSGRQRAIARRSSSSSEASRWSSFWRARKLADWSLTRSACR